MLRLCCLGAIWPVRFTWALMVSRARAGRRKFGPGGGCRPLLSLREKGAHEDFCHCKPEGGSGQSTTSVNLAAALGEKGRRVLVIDLDPQHSTTAWFGVKNAGKEECWGSLRKMALCLIWCRIRGWPGGPGAVFVLAGGG